MNKSIKRFVYFKNYSFSFLHISSSCFRQRTSGAEGYMDGASNET